MHDVVHHWPQLPALGSDAVILLRHMHRPDEQIGMLNGAWLINQLLLTLERWTTEPAESIKHELRQHVRAYQLRHQFDARGDDNVYKT